MENKAIFLDRDGTINVDYGYVSNIEKFEFIPGMIEILKKLQDLGYLLIVVSNQSGIGRNYYTKEDADNVFNYMCNELLKQGIKINKYYYCPHIDNDNCNCRKPKTGMIDNALKDFDIDMKKSFMIGDKDSDIQLAKNCNLKSILIKNNKYKNKIIPDYIAYNPNDIFKIVKKESSD